MTHMLRAMRHAYASGMGSRMQTAKHGRTDVLTEKACIPECRN